jgi:hypothetical protein
LASDIRVANVRVWVTAVVVVERSITTEVSATFINMLTRSDQTADLDLDQDGAELFAQALDEAALTRLEAALAALPTNVPGVRIGEGRKLKPFLEVAGSIGGIAATVLGRFVRSCSTRRPSVTGRSAGIRTARSW